MQIKLSKFCVSAVLALALPSNVHADTFGSGANSFNIDFVTIGNPGNANDTTGSPTMRRGVICLQHRQV